MARLVFIFSVLSERKTTEEQQNKTKQTNKKLSNFVVICRFEI